MPSAADTSRKFSKRFVKNKGGGIGLWLGGLAYQEPGGGVLSKPLVGGNDLRKIKGVVFVASTI